MTDCVVLNLITSLNDSYCALLFDNFFLTPNFIQTIFEKNIYSIEIVRATRKNMPTFSPDKYLKRGDCEFKTFKNVICVKWMDNPAVTLIGSNVGDLNHMSWFLRRQKGATSKSAMSCPIIVKKYNQSIMGVDLCDQYTAPYPLNQRSKFRFYLCIFFDLMDVAIVKSFIIYMIRYIQMCFDFLI